MKFIVVSDSHGLTKELDQLKDSYPDADGLIHCGDSELEVDHPAISGFLTVRGNCDWTGEFPEELVFSNGGSTFFVAHGHLLNVKSSLMNIAYRAEEHRASIICFGHSHLVGAELIDGRLFLNPGSIRLPRGRKERTFIVLMLNGTEAQVEIMDFDHRESPLEKVSFRIAER